MIGILLYTTWERRAVDARAREQALPRCVERLQDEQQCTDLLEHGHEDCIVFTRVVPSRFNRRKYSVDSNAYLECIVLTPARFLEKRRKDRDAAAGNRMKNP